MKFTFMTGRDLREVQFSIEEQLLHRNEKRSRGGLVFKAHRCVYHSNLGSRIRKKKEDLPEDGIKLPWPGLDCACEKRLFEQARERV